VMKEPGSTKTPPGGCRRRRECERRTRAARSGASARTCTRRSCTHLSHTCLDRLSCWVAFLRAVGLPRQAVMAATVRPEGLIAGGYLPLGGRRPGQLPLAGGSYQQRRLSTPPSQEIPPAVSEVVRRHVQVGDAVE